MSTHIERAEELTRKAAVKRAEANLLASKDSATAEEMTRFNALTAEADGLDAEAKSAREFAARIEANSAALGSYVAPAPRKIVGSAHEPAVVREAVIDDPKRGFRTPREFLQAVMAQKGAPKDERLKLLATAGSDEAGGYSDAYGGFLIPTAFSPNMLQTQAEADPTAAFTQKVPMGSPRVQIPARVDKSHSTSVSGGLRWYRRAEADTSSSSRVQFDMITLNATGLLGLAYATEEILMDSAVSFVALLESGFRDEYGAVIANEKINGVAGGMTGVVGHACTISVAKETGQAADTVEYANVIKMYARCYGKDRAIWLANHDVLPQLMQLNQAVGVGGAPVWQPSAREGAPNTLLGRPIFFTEYCATVGDAGDLILGDWSQYLEGTYEPMQSGESMHVRFVNHERAFKFWTRNAGTPWWSSVLTPKAGATLSPFVTLAARA